MPRRSVIALATVPVLVAGCSVPFDREPPAKARQGPVLPGLSRVPAWTIEAGQFGDTDGGGSLWSGGVFTVGTAFALAYTTTPANNEIVLLRAATGKALRRLPVPRNTRVRLDRAAGRPVLVAESPRGSDALDRWIIDEKGEVLHTATPAAPITTYEGGYLITGERINAALKTLGGPATIKDASGATIVETKSTGAYAIFGDLAVLDHSRVLDLKRKGRRLATLRGPDSATPASVHGTFTGKLLTAWRPAKKGTSALTLNDPRTGRAVWTRTLPGFTALTPRDVAYEPTERRLVINDPEARRQLALDVETGRTVWENSGPRALGLALPRFYYLPVAAWEPLIPVRQLAPDPYTALRVPKGPARNLRTAPAARSSDGYGLVRSGPSFYGFPLT